MNLGMLIVYDIGELGYNYWGDWLFFIQFLKKNCICCNTQTSTTQIANLYSFQWCYKTIRYKR